MDHHTLAAISIAGTFLDVLGSLYLAYDLLGGQHGPLRLLTRAVTYSIVFGVGYGIGLGLFFGLASGLATGITISIELNRAARGLPHYSLPWEGLFSAIRGLAFGAGLYRILGLEYAIAFGIPSPSVKYSPIHAACGPRSTTHLLAARALPGGNFGEPSFAPLVTSSQRLCVVLSCIVLPTRGLLPSE